MPAPEFILTGPLSEVRTASTAGGGTSLTTTAAFIAFPRKTNYVRAKARNYSTAVVVKYALNPWLVILKTTDKLATVANTLGFPRSDGQTVSSDQQCTPVTNLVLGTLPALASGGAVYVGADRPFRGVRVIMSASVNAVANTLAANYWNGTAWTSLTPTDGTASGGATFAVTGNITWTMPAAGLWVPAPLGTSPNTPPTSIAETTLQAALLNNPELYWARFDVSVALTAATATAGMFSMSRDTVQYDELIPGEVVEGAIFQDIHGIGNIEMLTDAGTANGIVSAGVFGTGGKFVGP